MNRRVFMTGLGAVLAAPRVAGAQATKAPRIGVLHPGAPATSSHFAAAFDQGLHEHGYREGQNIVLERRFAEAKAERISEIAAELVRLKVDVRYVAEFASQQHLTTATTMHCELDREFRLKQAEVDMRELWWKGSTGNRESPSR